MPPLPFARIDHLVFASPDLDLGLHMIEDLLGVRPSAGGQHLGIGTRNELIALGPATYLEVIGPDPDQPAPPQPRWFGIDELPAPKLVSWAAAHDDLTTRVQAARDRGVALGEVLSGSRKRPDGSVLSWQFSDPRTVVQDGIVPFLIDWGDTPSPAHDAADGCSLLQLEAEHPDAERVAAALEVLEIELPVRAGPAPSLQATIRSPRGDVVVIR